MSTTLERIQQALDEIRPFLKTDGGDITLVELRDDGVAVVQLHGNCIGCSVNQMTLRNGVEASIRRHAPEVTSVVELGTAAARTL